MNVNEINSGAAGRMAGMGYAIFALCVGTLNNAGHRAEFGTDSRRIDLIELNAGSDLYEVFMTDGTVRMLTDCIDDGEFASALLESVVAKADSDPAFADAVESALA